MNVIRKELNSPIAPQIIKKFHTPQPGCSPNCCSDPFHNKNINNSFKFHNLSVSQAKMNGEKPINDNCSYCFKRDC